MRRTIAALPTVFVLLAAACGSASDAPPGEPAALPMPQAPGAPTATGASAYPALYREMALPEIDGGTVTNTGRQTTSLRDGLAITVTSAKTVDEARVFYQEALAKAGWTAEPQGRGASVPNMPVARVAFSKGEVTYSAMITAVSDGGVRIDIRVMLS